MVFSDSLFDNLRSMARPKNQEKRRQELRRAASRAIAAGGSMRVSVRDVAQEAGMSPASVLYYYPDLEQLVTEALQHAMERFYDRRHARAESIADPRARIVATIVDGFPTDHDDHDVLMMYLGVPVIRREPVVASLIRTLTERQVSLYQAILEVGQAHGVFDLADDSLTIARNLVALEDAYGLYIINAQRSSLVDEAKRLTLAYASMATRCDLSLT